MRKAAYFFTLALSLACGSMAACAGRQAEARTPAAVITGDFNGDGRADEASLDTSKATVLVVVLNKGATIRLPTKAGPDAELELAPPGGYSDACVRGSGSDCTPEQRKPLDLRHSGIILNEAEASSTLYYWKDGGFKTLSLSD